MVIGNREGVGIRFFEDRSYCGKLHVIGYGSSCKKMIND